MALMSSSRACCRWRSWIANSLLRSAAALVPRYDCPDVQAANSGSGSTAAAGFGRRTASPNAPRAFERTPEGEDFRLS
jgi:hypothetical protein